MPRDNIIGPCRCPVCSSEKARLGVSSKQLAYITCDSCHVQVFGRSDRSDALLRELHVRTAPPAPPEPTNERTAPADPKLQPPAAVPAPAPPARTGLGWGVLA